MKKVINAPTWCVDGLDLPINCVKDVKGKKDSGCYVEILQVIYSQLMAILSRYNQILVVRVDLHFEHNPNTNEAISKIVKKFKRSLLKREYKKYHLEKVAHIWVRENTKDGSIHYHVIYIVNANRIQCPIPLNDEMCLAIMRIDHHVKIHFCQYEKIRRNDRAGVINIFYWLSYLAKENTKGQRKLSTNDYSSSRFKILKLSQEK
jgi:hypothetical protein